MTLKKTTFLNLLYLHLFFNKKLVALQYLFLTNKSRNYYHMSKEFRVTNKLNNNKK